MKRGLAAIIILSVCVIFSITISIMLEYKTQSVIRLAEVAVNNQDSAAALEKKWNSELIYFKLFTDHSYFESIDKKIRKLKYSSGETYDDTCTEIIIDLTGFKEYLSFSLPNIF